MSSLQSACGICFIDFDDASHQALSLPCGHVYCSQCLRSLQTTKRKSCPMCRQDWQECDVDSLKKCYGEKNSNKASDETIRNRKHMPVSEFEEVCEKQSVISETVLCKDHSLPFYYFCDHCKEFSCVRCVISKQPHCTFIMISDAITLIKLDISAKCKNIKCETENDLDELKTTLTEITNKMISIKEFREELGNIDQKLSSLTESLKAIELKRSQDLTMVTELEGATAQINTGNVITEVHSCLDALKTVHEGKINSLQFPELKSLFCHIVCAFQESQQPLNSGCSEAEHFINKLRDIEIASHQRFLSGGQWVANNNSSYQAALDALTKHRPAAVLVVATGQHSEDLLMKLLAALAGVECEVKLRFLDSFYYGDDASKDNKRLGQILKINDMSRPRLTEFIGYLPGASLTSLCGHLSAFLGLHCKSSDEFNQFLENVSSNFQQLTDIHISLAPGANINAPSYYSRGTYNFNNLYPCASVALHLHGMADADVQRLSQISAISQRCGISASSLHLPECRLSPAGAATLAQYLTTTFIIFLNSDVSYVRHQDGVIAALRMNGHTMETYAQKLDAAWDIPT